jgi:hypothetical protein
MRSCASERYLTVNGKRAFDLGADCETCRFLFERLPGAAQPSMPESLSASLRAGCVRLDDALMETASALLPDGLYRACLLRLTPSRVPPGSDDDYFTHEQAHVWGPNHAPRPTTPYYRVPALRARDGNRVHAFIVPMHHPDALRGRSMIAKYAQRLSEGAEPTAMAISTLDAKWPAYRHGAEPRDADLCLTHLLLDGHHKMEAAAMTGLPLTMLSFLALNHCVASPEQVETAVGAMRGPGRFER